MSLPDGIKSISELLGAQALVWNHIFNFINSMSLKCAIQLGLPDIIHGHGRPMTLSDLTGALPINKAKQSCLDRLMCILVHSKFFVKVNISEEEEGYWLTPASRLLLTNEPLSVAPFALAMLDPILIDPWHHMGEWFQNDDPTPFVTTHGKTFWEYAGREPRMNHFFNKAMASDARLVTNILTKHCKHVFEGLKSMVDVGGGTGAIAKLIGDVFLEMKCIVLELPHVVVGLEGTNNLTFVGGDMFQSIPPADAIFMKWILHDWPDHECVKILEKCKEAIPSKEKGGKVIIIDMVVDDMFKEDDKATETQLFFDMLMMTLASGRERSEKEWAKLFFAAGFSSYKIIPMIGLRSLIEVLP
ncbi:hypothetical protein BUALT_Bualt03G0190600 [Buddleja alternifolia]|uniref:Uncharacterized protein n=1 Tax=Buddleja alternifolia TaxID=168488 RepID=A0AAV6Y3J6_9LAMI|nr:hypothetical protein BUALT_Bualt03G0190600 [Buddleja alternifolia]